MIDKEYLKKLKENDFIEWDSLVNDPIIKGRGCDNEYILPIFSLIIIGLISYYLF